MGSSLLDEKPKHQYFASADLPAEAIFDLKRGILRAKGVQIGMIELISSPTEMEDLDDDFNALRSLHAWFGELTPFMFEDAMKRDKNGNETAKLKDEGNGNEDENYAESFCRTLICNRIEPSDLTQDFALCCYA
jgi:hypothetical protein